MKPGDRVTFRQLKLEHLRMLLQEGMTYGEIALIVDQTPKTVGRLAKGLNKDYSLPSSPDAPQQAPPPPPEVPPNEPPQPGA